MMTLKQQLERAVGGMLIANIPNDVYTMEVDYKYTTSERIICVDCEQGEANLITETNVSLVKVKNNDILELNAYIVMTPYEQTIWDTLYENGLLSRLYEKADTDSDGQIDELFRFDTESDKYYPMGGNSFAMPNEVEELKKSGTLDPEFLKGATVLSNEQFDKLMEKLSSGDSVDVPIYHPSDPRSVKIVKL